MPMLSRRVLVAVLALAACTSAAPPPMPTTTIPITDFQQVAGKWAGEVTGLTGTSREQTDWVEMTIMPDGTYEFDIARTIGVMMGKGKFMMADGKLTQKGERGVVVYTLTERGGKQILHADGRLESNNARVTADLARKK